MYPDCIRFLLHPACLCECLRVLVYRRFFRQALPLFISLAVIGALSVVIERIGEDSQRAPERILIESVPEVPDVSDWPGEFIERLHLAHEGIESSNTRRVSLLELARLYHANGFESHAQHCYAGLQELEPENPAWPYMRAALLHEGGDPAQELDRLLEVVALDGERAEAYLRLGRAYERAGFEEEGLKAYRFALSLEPENPWPGVFVGAIMARRGQYEVALLWLERALELDGDIELALELKYDALLERGDLEAARRVRKSLESRELRSRWRDPHLSFLSDYCFDVVLLISFAEEEMSDGSLAKSLEILERATELEPGNPDVVAALGDLASRAQGGEQPE